jgi:hypothetical protein
LSSEASTWRIASTRIKPPEGSQTNAIRDFEAAMRRDLQRPRDPLPPPIHGGGFGLVEIEPQQRTRVE